MAAKKKIAVKTKAPKEKRPPRQFFIAYETATGEYTSHHPTRKDAKEHLMPGEKIAGPYVLAERVGQR